MAEVNWKKIKAEYIRGGTSYRRLAEKYGVSVVTLAKLAKREQWQMLRKQRDDKETTKITDSIAEENAAKAVKIYDVADKLLDKILFNLENSDFLGSQEIKQYTSAIKDIKDIKGIKSDIDLKEQNARIDKLRKEAEDEQTDTAIKVVFEDEISKYGN